MSVSTVDEMRGYVQRAVESRHDAGRARAVHEAARELGLTERRAWGLLRREVRRVWADELDGARSWYRAFLAREEWRLHTKAMILAAERARLDEQDRKDGVI